MSDKYSDTSTFIQSLPSPLREYASAAFPPPPDSADAASNKLDGDAATLAASNAKLLDDFEIATRSHLLESIEQLLSSSSSSSSTMDIQLSLLQYLKNVTLLVLQLIAHSSPSTSGVPISLKKLPFLLLEDAIDSLPLTHIQTLWSSSDYPTMNISSFFTSSSNTTTTTAQQLLTNPTIFIPGSKFILLRICNKILKMTSNQSVDASFAGSIMVLLAQCFPLSERSAVNVLGTFNVKNECLLEGEDEFDEGGGGGHAGGATAGDAIVNGGDVDGGGGKKSVNGSGKSPKIGYEFYKTFWGVQKVFTDPQGTILASRGGLAQAKAYDAYNGFVKDVVSILVALESTPVTTGTKSTVPISTPMRDCESHKDDNNNNIDIVRHHKYLTSSQLLHLQLRDPTLRLHFLSQLLIILSYLTSSSSPNAPISLPTGITPTPGSDMSKLSAQIKKTQMKQLGDIFDRARQLLLKGSGTTNNGSDTGEEGVHVLKSLLWLLKDRESMWKSWKRNKCLPSMDKVGAPSVGGREIQSKFLVANLSSKKKRKKMQEGEAMEGVVTVGATSPCSNNNNNNILQLEDCQQKSTVPNLATFLEPYTDACDPENGIDDEYHPKNDQVYSWRALRLLARDDGDGDDTAGCCGHLMRFNKLRRKDGDFEGIVRDSWMERGQGIGGSLGEDYYEEEMEEDEEEKDEQNADAGVVQGKDKDTDADMDCVSVGTPEPEAEAKKEQQAEMDRVAMEMEEEMLNEEEGDAETKGEEKEMKEGDGDGDKKKAKTGDNGKMEDLDVDESAAKKVVGERKDSNASEIRDAATETVMSMFNEEPVKKVAPTKKEESKAASYVPPAKRQDSAKPAKDTSKEEAKTPKAQDDANTDKKPATTNDKQHTANGGKNKETQDKAYKAAVADTSSNGKKKDDHAAPNKSSLSNQQSQQQQGRAKFTPPPQKSNKNESQHEQSRHHPQQHRNDSRDNNNNNSRGVGVGGGGGGGGRHGGGNRNNDQHGGPGERRGPGRNDQQQSSHHSHHQPENRGQSSDRRGPDRGGGGGSRDNTSDGRGGQQGQHGNRSRSPPNPGKGNVDGDGPKFNVGSSGQNPRFEPPHRGGRGGRGRGGGRGYRGGGRGGGRGRR